MNALVLDNGNIFKVTDTNDLLINSSYRFKPEVWKTFSTIPLTGEYTQQLDNSVELRVYEYESKVFVRFWIRICNYPDDYRGPVPDTPFKVLVVLNLKQWSAVLRFLQAIQHPLFPLIAA